VTRSIGDSYLAQYLDQTPDVLISSVDELREMCGLIRRDSRLSMNITSSCFMILGSDGLWDSVSNDEAIHFVQDRLVTTLPAANSLQSISHDLGTRCPSLGSWLGFRSHTSFASLGRIFSD
jgi:serine/threonine protein phosphatase PrpC